MQQVAEVKSLPVSEATFADLLKPLIDPGFRLALAMLHDAQAAEDAVQEASFTAWRKLGRMRDQGRLRPWFLGVVANKCRNARRSKWSAAVSLGVSEELSVMSVEDRTLRGADLRRAIARLGHDDRLVVALYFYLDMPVDEVATVAGASVGATRARLYRAIRKLRPE
ncbi:MAG TPA: sigma-70 family RNA polymerase sigma factor, partial [Candidatus Dormibacteraeota bacterium]|nr:sigma-70 family RNA polymerase sigma factor [Candidatus Dormibacteraeota bacterium]